MNALVVSSFRGCFCSLALPAPDGLFYPARSFFAGLESDMVVAVVVDGVYQGFATLDAARSFASNPPPHALLVPFADLDAQKSVPGLKEVA